MGDGCDAIGRVVLGAVPTSARQTPTHRRVVYDIYTGKVDAPCLTYEGLEFCVVKVLHIKATDGREAAVHVCRDMAMQPVGATQVDRHAACLRIVVEVETDGAGCACAYVHNVP